MLTEDKVRYLSHIIIGPYRKALNLVDWRKANDASKAIRNTDSYEYFAENVMFGNARP